MGTGHDNLISDLPLIIINIVIVFLGIVFFKKVFGKDRLQKALSFFSTPNHPLKLTLFISFLSACIFKYFIEQFFLSFFILGLSSSLVNSMIIMIATSSTRREIKIRHEGLFTSSVKLLLMSIRFLILYACIFYVFFYHF
mgnify:CR=1 FL=1